MVVYGFNDDRSDHDQTMMAVLQIDQAKYLKFNCKEKEPKDEQLCITVHTINNICDANSLDDLSNKGQLSEYCLR